jgi:hypothetical protein
MHKKQEQNPKVLRIGCESVLENCQRGSKSEIVALNNVQRTGNLVPNQRTCKPEHVNHYGNFYASSEQGKLRIYVPFPFGSQHWHCQERFLGLISNRMQTIWREYKKKRVSYLRFFVLSNWLAEKCGWKLVDTGWDSAAARCPSTETTKDGAEAWKEASEFEVFTSIESIFERRQD